MREMTRKLAWCVVGAAVVLAPVRPAEDADEIGAFSPAVEVNAGHGSPNMPTAVMEPCC